MSRRSWDYLMARGRVKTADRVSTWLLGSTVGRWPSTYAGSLVERCTDPQVAKHHLGVHLSAEPVVECYPFPDWYPPSYRRLKAFDPIVVHEMAEVVADPHTGLVWLPNGGPTVGESYGSLLKSMAWDDVRHVRLLRVSRRVIDQPAVVLPVTGYFHYLLEVVPAVLRALEVHSDAAVVVRDGPLPTYVRDSIRALGLADRLLPCDRPARFTRLLFSTFPQQSGFVHPDSVRLLRQALQPVPATQGQRLLYLGRRTASARNVPNEADLERVLSEQGFEVIDLAGLDLQSQIDVIGQAAAVVGLHGAALANLVWAKRGTRVLELHPAPEFNDCYGRLALTCGLDYRGAILPRRRDALLPDEAIDLAASLSAAMVAGMSHP